jgi:hypothetical protein
VKHKLEGKFYAIKRVKIQLDNVDETNIREKLRSNSAYKEVISLSSAETNNHSLRYYNAWFEA